MVIRITKATRFFALCAIALIAFIISVSTRSITVSTPYAAVQPPLPIVVYRGATEDAPTAMRQDVLQSDIDYFAAKGYSPVSERELLAALRRQSPLPEKPVLLVFDNKSPNFAAALPLLEENELPWFSLEETGALSQELRAAGYPVARLERAGDIPIDVYDF
ncbi:MAG: hypothetical protein LBB67_01135 [Oscillospiraceae bacterium]|nr:hypothetical protein [Oscillospiraceae bacterium]